MSHERLAKTGTRHSDNERAETIFALGHYKKQENEGRNRSFNQEMKEVKDGEHYILTMLSLSNHKHGI